MEVSVEIHKIIESTTYSTVFSSVGGVDGVFMRLLLIEKIVKDVNLKCISFRVKYPQSFWEL